MAAGDTGRGEKPRGVKSDRKRSIAAWKLNVEVDPHLRRTFHVIAHAQGRTMRDVMEELIRNYIDENVQVLSNMAIGKGSQG